MARQKTKCTCLNAGVISIQISAHTNSLSRPAPLKISGPREKLKPLWDAYQQVSSYKPRIDLIDSALVVKNISPEALAQFRTLADARGLFPKGSIPEINIIERNVTAKLVVGKPVGENSYLTSSHPILTVTDINGQQTSVSFNDKSRTMIENKKAAAEAMADKLRELFPGPKATSPRPIYTLAQTTQSEGFNDIKISFPPSKTSTETKLLIARVISHLSEFVAVRNELSVGGFNISDIDIGNNFLHLTGRPHALSTLTNGIQKDPILKEAEIVGFTRETDSKNRTGGP